ncbi:MAG: two-component regulator propeller domain-containing protein, partial [Bacteroidota bacterium]
MYRLILLLTCLGGLKIVFAQNYLTSVTQYTQEDGLSHNQIHWIHKDQRGMIWVGAANGINRYDGHSFKLVDKSNFYYAKNQYLIEDGQGDLWLKKSDRTSELYFFNTITESSKSFEEKFGQAPPFSKEHFDKAIVLADQTIIITTHDGQLISYDTLGRFKSYPALQHPKGLRINAHPHSNYFWVQQLLLEADVTLPITSEEIAFLSNIHLCHFDGEIKVIHSLPLPQYSMPIGVRPNDHLLFMDEQQQAWELSKQGELSKIELPPKLMELPTSASPVLDYDSQQDRFIRCIDSKIMVFPRKEGKLPFSSQYYKDLDLTNYYCQLIEDDRYWLGSINGLIKVQLTNTPFGRLLHKDPNNNPQSNFISCRNIFASSDSQQLIVKRYIKDKDSLHIQAQAFYLDLKTGGSRYFPPPVPLEYFPDKWAYYRDQNNRLWLGDYHGLIYLDKDSQKTQLFDQFNGFSALKGLIVYHFYKDRQERLWLCTDNGLFELDVEQGVLAHYSSTLEGAAYLSSKHLRHMHQDEEGIFWLASSDGLIRWDKEKGQQRLFTTQDGFSHNQI